MAKLNALVWPHIRKSVDAEVARAAGDGAEAIVVEAAVLLDAGWDTSCDHVWIVTASPDVAKARLMARNGLSEGEALKRINSQSDRRPERAVMINNDGGLADLAKQVKALYQRHLCPVAGGVDEVVMQVDEDNKPVGDVARSEVVRYASHGARARCDGGGAHTCRWVVRGGAARQDALAPSHVHRHQELQVRGSSSGARARTIPYPLMLVAGSHPPRCVATVARCPRHRDQLYVQKRTWIKDYCPGAFDPVTGGVVAAGEEYPLSAEREAEEEMGVSGVPLDFLFTFKYTDERTRVRVPRLAPRAASVAVAHQPETLACRCGAACSSAGGTSRRYRSCPRSRQSSSCRWRMCGAAPRLASSLRPTACTRWTCTSGSSEASRCPLELSCGPWLAPLQLLRRPLRRALAW